MYESALRFSGRVPNFHKILGHMPDAYRWYLPFQKAVQRNHPRSHLAAGLRSLASLATSEFNRCRYCASHGTSTALHDGVSSDKVEWLRHNPTAEPDQVLFDERERAIIEWARAVTSNQARRATDLFANLQRHFSDSEIVELTVVAAARTFTNLIQEALWTDLESEGSETQANARGSDKGAAVRDESVRVPLDIAMYQHALLCVGQLALSPAEPLAAGASAQLASLREGGANLSGPDTRG